MFHKVELGAVPLLRCHAACFPDRDSADCELTRVRREHGPNLLKAKIIKDRPSKHGDPNERTYRLNYVVRETRTEKLF